MTLQQNDLKEQVENKLKHLIKETNNFQDEECSLIYQQLIDSDILHIVPPEETEEIHIKPSTSHTSPGMLTYITNESLVRVKSIKPGNIILNFKKLFSLDAAGAITEISGLLLSPLGWTKFLAIIPVIRFLYNLATFDITKEHYYLIVSLWGKCDKNNYISRENGYDAFVDFLNNNNIKLNNTSYQEYEKLLETLEKIHSIKIHHYKYIELKEKLKEEFPTNKL